MKAKDFLESDNSFIKGYIEGFNSTCGEENRIPVKPKKRNLVQWLIARIKKEAEAS